MFRNFSWRLVLAIMASAAGGSFQFYNLVVINVSQDVVSMWINQTYIQRGVHHTESWLTMYWSVLVGMPHFGACIGCAISGPMADKLGRRTSLIVNGLSSVLAAILVIIASGADLPEFLFLSRLFFGISLGMASAIVPMYATETAPVRYRGAFGSVHIAAGSIGDLLGVVVGLPRILGSKSLWPLAFALPGIPALIMTLVLPFCHDSPRYLMITKKDSERTYKALVFFLGDTNADEAYKDLIQEANYTNRCSAGNNSFIWSVINLFTLRELRMPLLISIVMAVGQEFTGTYAVFSYSSEIFQDSGIDPYPARLGAVGCGVAYIVATCGAAYLVDKAGRRKLMIFQYIGCILTLALFTMVQGFMKEIISASISGGLVLTSIVVYSAFFGAGCSLPYIVSCELFTQDYRSQAVSIVTFIIFFLAFLTSGLYLPFSKLVCVAWSFIPFIVISTLIVSVLVYLLPETNNKTVEEITRDLIRGGYHKSPRRKAIASTSDELLELYDKNEVEDGKVLNGSLHYGSVGYP